MATITPQQTQERLAALPAPLQDAVFSVETADIIRDIGEKFDFSPAAVSDLAEVVGLALMGFIHPDTVKEELAERLNASEENLSKTAAQVEERILNRFKKLLVDTFYAKPEKKTAPAEGEVAEEEVKEEAPAFAFPKAQGVEPTEPAAPALMTDIHPTPSGEVDLSPPPRVSINEGAPFVADVTRTPGSLPVRQGGAAPAAEEEKREEPAPAEIPEEPAPAPLVIREEDEARPLGSEGEVPLPFSMDSGNQFENKTAERPEEAAPAAEVELGVPAGSVPAKPEGGNASVLEEEMRQEPHVVHYVQPEAEGSGSVFPQEPAAGTSADEDAPPPPPAAGA